MSGEDREWGWIGRFEQTGREWVAEGGMTEYEARSDAQVLNLAERNGPEYLRVKYTVRSRPKPTIPEWEDEE